MSSDRIPQPAQSPMRKSIYLKIQTQYISIGILRVKAYHSQVAKMAVVEEKRKECCMLPRKV